jgi:hypothetical protein
MNVVKRLVIIGAGGYGCEVAFWALEAREQGTEWQPKGFIDDNPAAFDGFAGCLPLMGRVSDYQPEPDDVFVCAIGAVAVKERCEGGAGEGWTFHPLDPPHRSRGPTGAHRLRGCSVSARRGVGRCHRGRFCGTQPFCLGAA